MQSCLQEICSTVHENGGQVYMDGANMLFGLKPTRATSLLGLLGFREASITTNIIL